MNLFGFNIQIAREKKTIPAAEQRSFDPQAWLAGEDVGSGPALSNAYEQVVWVYRAVNVLAEQVANVPFVFSAGERGKENLITSGPLLDFYNRPHPQLNRFQYWELRIIWLMLRGECFRVPIYEDASGGLSFSPEEQAEERIPRTEVSRLEAPNQPTPSPSPPPIRGLAGRAGERRPLLCSADGFGGTRTYSGAQQGSPAQSRSDRAPAVPRRRLRQVLILDPARFQHIVEDHRLIGWRYTGFGPRAPLASQVFLPEEVWFERLPNPFDFWRGFPPLQAAEMAARTDYAAGLFMRGIIENNADTGVIVRTDKWLSDEQRTQILAALRDRKRGAGIADRPVLLLGSTEVIKPQLSSTDLQFLENRKFSRAEICAAFGVPEEVVTSTDHAKYDVMAGARLNFIENRVAPLCSRLEAAEDATVKSIDPAASGWFDLDSLPIMQESRRNRLAAARTGFDMGVPFNELNRVLDLGFKPLPWGDQGFVSGSLRKLGEGLKSEGRNPKSERNPKTEIRSEANESVFGVGCIPGESIEIERDQDDVFARAQWLLEQVEGAGLPKADPAALSKLRRFLFDQRGRMLEGLAAATKSGWAAASGGGSPGSEAPGVEQLIDSVFVLPRENAELARMLGPVFISADGPADPERDRAMDCIARFNEAVRDALHEAVRPACGGGELPSDLAARVKDFYNRHSSQIVAAAAVEFGRLLSLPQTKQQ